VRGDVEVAIIPPVRAGRRLRGHLPKTPEDEKAFVDDTAQTRERQAAVEHQHAADHHQVGGPIHPQPRGIDRRKLFAPGHGTRRKKGERPRVRLRARSRWR
jgi:hypothetical protein